MADSSAYPDLPRKTPAGDARGKKLVAAWAKVFADPVVCAFQGRAQELWAIRCNLPVWWKAGYPPPGVRLLRGVIDDPELATERLIETIAERHPALANVMGCHLREFVYRMMIAAPTLASPERALQGYRMRTERFSAGNPITVDGQGVARLPREGTTRAHTDELLKYNASMLPARRTGRPVGAVAKHLSEKSIRKAHKKLLKFHTDGTNPTQAELADELGTSTDTLRKFLYGHGLAWPIR